MLYKKLVENDNEYVLSKQLVRCGTSIGANVEEAIGGYSKKDFAAKLSISYKEARETKFWLRLLHATDFINDQSFEPLSEDREELLRILYSIINTTKNK